MNPVLICHRHQLQTFFLAGGMQGKGQGNGKLLIGQFPDAGYDSAGGNRQISLAYVQSVFICQKFYEFKKIVIIIKGLSGSHHNNIGNPLPDILSNLINLIQHLRRGKTTLQSIQRGGTETAAHTAAYLRGNADRISMLIFHQYTLNDISILQKKQIFSCAINF